MGIPKRNVDGGISDCLQGGKLGLFVWQSVRESQGCGDHVPNEVLAGVGININDTEFGAKAVEDFGDWKPIVTLVRK
jgi:hypothetical protein